MLLDSKHIKFPEDTPSRHQRRAVGLSRPWFLSIPSIAFGDLMLIILCGFMIAYGASKSPKAIENTEGESGGTKAVSFMNAEDQPKKPLRVRILNSGEIAITSVAGTQKVTPAAVIPTLEKLSGAQQKNIFLLFSFEDKVAAKDFSQLMRECYDAGFNKISFEE